jgi:uncharacterized spore protein YtfJ
VLLLNKSSLRTVLHSLSGLADIRYDSPMEQPVSAGIKLEDVFKSIIEHAGAKAVYGEPVSVDGKTVLPVAQIRYGFGSGGKGNGQHGGGGGLIAKPFGVVEITQSQTRFIPIRSSRALVIAVSLGVCLGFLAGSRRG